jgi:RNA polymerase-binding transcription factor DksA
LPENSKAEVILSDNEEIRAKLEARRDELEKRLERIDEDVRRPGGPLDPQAEEQLPELANDEVLDGIDEISRTELEAIYNTLRRIERGEFGTCSKCGEPIPTERLEALPHSEHCVACAEEKG